MSDVIKKLTSLIKTKGARAAVAYLFQRHLWLKQTIVFFKKSLNENVPHFEVQLNNVVFKKLGYSDLQSFQDYEDHWHTVMAAKEKFNQGNELYCLEKDAQRFSYLWVEFKQVRIADFDLQFNLPKDVAYISCLYTRPELRGRGANKSLYSYVLNVLKKKAIQDIFIVIEPSNAISIHIAKQMGFVQYAKLTFMKLLWFKYYLPSNISRAKPAFLLRTKDDKNFSYDIYKKFLSPIIV